MEVKSKSLTKIENDTSYYGCTFFLDETCQIKNCFFENCSFRTKVICDHLENNRFENCNFSDGFYLSFVDAEITELPKNLGDVSKVTSLYIMNTEITKLPKEIESCFLLLLTYIYAKRK